MDGMKNEKAIKLFMNYFNECSENYTVLDNIINANSAIDAWKFLVNDKNGVIINVDKLLIWLNKYLYSVHIK
jgi:hypothetical protein